MIKLSVPDIGQEELNEIQKVFESKYLVHGDKVEEFEEGVKQYLNVKNVIAVSSGTAALHLSLLALDIGEGDEVIVPDFTFPATANVVEVCGADTKLVDIKLQDFCIDVDKIEEQITERTKAIIPVHEFGQSADMDRIIELSKKYNLKIIEDAACAFGAEYKGLKVGTIGDLGCFSLHPRKAITTGEGGIIVTNNDKLAEKIRILRNHGLSYKNGKAEFVTPGLNYRMTNIQGAIGVVQLKKADKLNKKRIEAARKYNRLFENIGDVITPLEREYGKHIWQTYHIVINKDICRDELIKNLRLKGIETNFGAYSVHSEPYYEEKYSLDDKLLSNSKKAHENGLALPLHQNLTDLDIELIVEEIKGQLL